MLSDIAKVNHKEKVRLEPRGKIHQKPLVKSPRKCYNHKYTTTKDTEMAGKRNKGTGPRPHTWVTGPDPVRHKQYSTWLQCKAQASYRNEIWKLEFADYVAAWGDSWAQRGRTKNSLQLQRKDHTLPWSKANVHVVNRTEFRLKQQQIKDQKRAQRKAQDE